MANQIVVSAGAKVRNLSGVLTGTSGVVSSVPLGAANGVATLDSGGKVPVSQLPSSVVTYLGTWNAATNTPTLANGTGDAGDMYICNVAGTVNFGAGPVVFVVGDWVLYGSGTWQKSSGQNGTVTSVAITETGDSLNITGSPITTSGTINIGFNGTNLQYVNGAGNLTTFPILTGYVPYTGATANLNLGIYSFIANDGAYNTEMSPSYFGVENAAGTIFGLLEYNKLTLTNSTGAGSTMIVNAQGLIFPDASVQTSSYTDAKARLALSLTTTGTSGVATYNNATGVFNIPNYGSALTGYVPYTGATQDVDLGAFKLNAQSLHIKGTAGNGHLGLKHQSASPTASANEVSLFADSLGDLSWLNGNLYLSKFITSGNTAARSYTFPDATCNIPNDSLVVHLAGTETITGAKTFSGGVTFSSSVTTNNLTFANSGFFLTLQPPTLSVNRTVTLPNATGTLALTSDIPSITGLVPYTGATGNVTLGVYSLTANQLIAGGASTNNVATFTTYDQGVALQLKGSTGDLLFVPLFSPTVGAKITSQNSAGSAYTPLSFYASIFYFNSNVNFASTIGNGTYTYTLPSATGTIALVGGAGVGTVTSVAALTIGTSGTDLSSSVATSTTTPVITLNVPTASASNRGALSSADWTTFNNKQSALTNPVTGTGTTNYLPKFTGASTIGNSIISESGTIITISGSLYSSGTLRLTGSSSVDIQAYTGAAYSNLNYDAASHNWQTSGGTAKMILSASGNLGLGVTPSAWNSAFVGLDFNLGAWIASQTNANILHLGSNGYVNSAGNWVYKNSTFASRYEQYESVHKWFTAPSGTAGNAITFTQAMTLTASGRLLLGTASEASYMLDVNGTGRFSSSSTNQLTLNGGTTVATRLLVARGSDDSSQNLLLGWNSITVQRTSVTITDPQTDFSIIQQASNGSRTALYIASTGAAAFSSSVQADGSSNGFLINQNGGAAGLATYSANTDRAQIAFKFAQNYPASNNYTRVLDIVSTGDATGGGMIRLFTTVNNSTPSAALTLASTGAATFSSSVSATGFFESSDSRLKTLIQDNYQTKGIASITPKLYTKNGKVELGYYAQDFVGILDSAVSKGSDDMLSLSYREVHTAKIYALEQEIKELKAKMN